MDKTEKAMKISKKIIKALQGVEIDEGGIALSIVIAFLASCSQDKASSLKFISIVSDAARYILDSKG